LKCEIIIIKLKKLLHTLPKASYSQVSNRLGLKAGGRGWNKNVLSRNSRKI